MQERVRHGQHRVHGTRGGEGSQGGQVAAHLEAPENETRGNLHAKYRGVRAHGGDNGGQGARGQHHLDAQNNGIPTEEVIKKENKRTNQPCQCLVNQLGGDALS